MNKFTAYFISIMAFIQSDEKIAQVNRMKKLFFLFFILIFHTALRSAVFDASQHFAYIRDLYNKHDKKLQEFILSELDQFTNLYPNSDDIVEAHYLIAQVYAEKGDEHEALASYLKTMFLFPNSPRHANSAEAIRQLVVKEKAFKGASTEITRIISRDLTAEQEADRYFNYLQFCRTLNLSKLSDWLVRESSRFIEKFSNDERIDVALQIAGDLYREMGDEEKSAATYLKLEYLAPQSEIIPYVRFQRAQLLYKKLGEAERAEQIFTQVAREHPQSLYAANALFFAGEIEEKKKKDYNAAIVQYRLAVDTYPEGEKVIEALWRIAEINVDRLKDFAAGIGTFKEIAEKYPNNPRAIKALEEASDVYKSRLNDYEKAAQTLIELAEKYPNFEKSPDMLYRAGEIMKKEQGDFQKAIAYYEMVIQKYPDHKRADKARKEIEKIKEKLGEGK
jgi:TolA-binding protein